MDMVNNDRKYKRVANAIGMSLIFMLIFIRFVLFNVSDIIAELLLPFGEKVSYTVSMIVQIFLYLAAFMVPAFILRKLLKKQGLMQPMRLEFKLCASDLLIIPVTIAVSLSITVVNSLIVRFFLPVETVGGAINNVAPYAPYQVVLLFISGALVPAVCEEFLFRGAVASSLMPYGKGVAIVGSAVLFALMHQNPYQLFYTLVAGILLGYIYVKTGSILCSTILHLCNNTLAALFDLCITNIGGELGIVCYYIIMVAVYVVGFVSLLIYFYIEKKKKKNRFEGGSFGRVIEAGEEYAQISVTKGKKLRYFLAPTVIVYCVITLLNAIGAMIIPWLVYFIGS